MKNFRKVARGVDTLQLQAALDAQPELWTMDRYWKDHPQPIFREVDSIFLRFVQRAPYFYASQAQQFEAMCTVDPWEAYDEPAMKRLPEARKHIFGLMGFLEGERLGRVMLDRMAPGAHILPHSDIAADLRYYDRYHLVLTSNPGVEFRCGDESVNMAPGEVWWFDNAVEHEVWNRGDSDRVHMIVDVSRQGRRPPPLPAESGPVIKPVDSTNFGYEADNIFIKQLIAEKVGDTIHQHAHEYAHISMVPAGSAWRVECEGEEPFDVYGPTGIKVKANKFHGMTALLPNSHLYCTHNTHGFPLDQLEEKLIARRNDPPKG